MSKASLQTEEAFTVKEYKHTQTHTTHKQKHTQTQQQQQQQRLEELTMRPKISNIGTATYEIAKYSNKPLSKSEYNILNTEKLTRRLREETILAGNKMISVNVESLFTNAPLDKTIDFVLKKVYGEKKI